MQFKSSAAYLLVYHGSRDARPQSSANHLARLVAERLRPLILPQMEEDTLPPISSFPCSSRSSSQASDQPDLRSRRPLSSQAKLSGGPLVGTAALELAPLPLYRQIQEFGNRAYAVGCSELHILPLFLLQGVHVTDDIPAELDQARQMLNPGLRIHLHPSLGSHPQMTDYVQASFHQDLTRPSSARLLVAHGSRRAGGNASIEAIATQVGASTAYWSVHPSLMEQVDALTASGYQHIAVFPYFLFAGGITDAIAETIKHLSERFSTANFSLSPPLGATAYMADLIVDLLMKPGIVP